MVNPGVRGELVELVKYEDRKKEVSGAKWSLRSKG